MKWLPGNHHPHLRNAAHHHHENTTLANGRAPHRSSCFQPQLQPQTVSYRNRAPRCRSSECAVQYAKRMDWLLPTFSRVLLRLVRNSNKLGQSFLLVDLIHDGKQVIQLLLHRLSGSSPTRLSIRRPACNFPNWISCTDGKAQQTHGGRHEHHFVSLFSHQSFHSYASWPGLMHSRNQT